MKSGSPPFTKRPDAKRKSSSMQSKTDWSRLKAKGAVSVPSEHPEADIRHVMSGVVRRGLKPQPPKTAVSLRVSLMNEYCKFFQAILDNTAAWSIANKFPDSSITRPE